MLFLQLYLLSGLVLHKLIWEVLRHKAQEQPTESGSFTITIVKAVKITILIGLAIQIWIPDTLPITREPISIRVIGTIIFSIGLAIAIFARIQLGENWSNIETGQVLDRQIVVDNGVYKYIRHPIYTGDLLLLFGLELALNSWLILGVLVLAPVVVFKAIKEERMLISGLPGYGKYCQSSKRFIPFVF